MGHENAFYANHEAVHRTLSPQGSVNIVGTSGKSPIFNPDLESGPTVRFRPRIVEGIAE